MYILLGNPFSHPQRFEIEHRSSKAKYDRAATPTAVRKNPNEHGSIMQCPKCDRGELRRTARKGFLEQEICARVGYYPWKCPACKYRTLLKNRGQRSTDRKF